MGGIKIKGAKKNIINNNENHICIILKNNHLLDFMKELFNF
jgi:hypothetical protein